MSNKKLPKKQQKKCENKKTSEDCKICRALHVMIQENEVSLEDMENIVQYIKIRNMYWGKKLYNVEKYTFNVFHHLNLVYFNLN